MKNIRNFKLTLFSLSWLMFFTVSSVSADIYKCKNVDGKFIYTTQECSNGVMVVETDQSRAIVIVEDNRETEKAVDKTIGWLNGIWEGIGYQDDGSSWSIKLTVNSAANSYSIEYPSIPCGGIWTLVNSDSNQAKFTEKIKHGFNNCLNNGQVIITKIDGLKIKYYYTHPEAAANATLIKSTPNR